MEVRSRVLIGRPLPVYEARFSLLHRAPVQAKMIYFTALFLLVLVLGHPFHMLVLSAGLLVLVAFGGLWGQWWKLLRPFVPLFVVFITLNIVFVPRGPVVFEAGFVLITETGLWFGLAMALRLLAVVTLFSLVSLAIHPDDLLRSISSRWGQLGLVAALAVRLYPTLAQDAARLSEANRARGLSAGRGPISRSRRATAVLVPLLRRSLERSLDVSEALEVRGFATRPRLPRMRPRPDPGQTAFLLLVLVLGLTILFLAIAGVGLFDFSGISLHVGPLELVSLSLLGIFPFVFIFYWWGRLV